MIVSHFYNYIVMAKNFERKTKGDKPVVAICYDFDKTLSPDDMQAQGYIQSVGYEVNEFWMRSNGLAEENEMDQNLAYMLTMKDAARGKIVVNKKNLENYGRKVKLYPGVPTWFKRIREYGKRKGVVVEHYIISSGLKEMIEGTKVAHEFEKIYASSFYFDNSGTAVWPAQVVNYTGKTQFLFRISKGTLDVNDPAVNDYFPPESLRVPFRNIVYIGDSATDIPCMKLVNSRGGHSIGVYDPAKMEKGRVFQMMEDNRIRYYAPADYAKGGELDMLVKAIIDRTVYNERLEDIHYGNKKEFLEYKRGVNEEDEEKKRLILALRNSGSFAATHSIIAKLSKYDDWSEEDKTALMEIRETNSQVAFIQQDPDIDLFYASLE